MWRHLVAADRQLGGMLLVNVARRTERPRWTVTLAALKTLHPQWFVDPETMQDRIEQLEEENAQLRSRVLTLEKVQNVHQRALQTLRPTGT